MRLSKTTTDIFIQSITGFLTKNSKAELRLYGSRTDDSLKGGDIDLLLLTDTIELACHLKRHKHDIFADIFSHIEEQKIDLLIVATTSLPENPFAQMALEKSILLHKWQ